MSERKTKSKKVRPKSSPLGKEILAALSEFTDALKRGEVAKHLRLRQAKADAMATNHKPATRKKLRMPPGENGKK